MPGRIDTPTARGCHALIKQGAKLVETIDDICDEVQALLPRRIETEATQMKRLPDMMLGPEEAAMIKSLGGGGLHIDALAREAGLPAARLNALLLGLEMKRLVRILPGRFVELREELATK